VQEHVAYQDRPREIVGLLQEYGSLRVNTNG